MTSEEFIQNHSAFWQQSGFDFQFALFIKYLFECDFNDVVKYEDEDDIVIEHESGAIDLIQVKHSFQVGKKMTNSSEDVWKTLINWLQFLNLQEKENKNTRDVKCILVVNMTPAHDFLTIIDKVRHGEADYEDVVKCLNQLCKFKTCMPYVEKLKKEKKNIMKLISKIEVVRMNNPITDMFESFCRKYSIPILADNVLFSIVGKLWNLKNNHKKGVFQFCVKDFLYEFQADLQKITIKAFEAIEDEEERELPANYHDLLMVKQLNSVGVSDSISLSVYFGHYWCYQNSINTYCVCNHTMSEDLRKKIEQMVIRTWKNIYVDANHELLNNDEEMNNEKTVKSCGYSCLSQSMKADVNYYGTLIKPHFSSGWMLALSNEINPRVFWRVDWRKEKE